MQENPQTSGSRRNSAWRVIQTFYELFQNTFWWRGEVTLHRRFNIYSTGATSKTTKCLLIQMCQKKLTVALWCTFVPRDFERVLEPRRFRLRQTAERATGAFIVGGCRWLGWLKSKRKWFRGEQPPLSTHELHQRTQTWHQSVSTAHFHLSHHHAFHFSLYQTQQKCTGSSQTGKTLLSLTLKTWNCDFISHDDKLWFNKVSKQRQTLQ